MAILDDHSSTITAVRFFEEKGVAANKSRVKMISSGADKQLIVRSINSQG